MLTATAMSAVMAILAAMVAVDTKSSGIVAAAMIFLYQAFYTWVSDRRRGERMCC